MSKDRKRKNKGISVRSRIRCFMEALPDLNPNWKNAALGRNKNSITREE